MTVKGTELVTVAGQAVGQTTDKAATAKTRKTGIRWTLIGTTAVVVVTVFTFLIKFAVDEDNKLKDSQIAAVQKFGDDRDWKHTGRWYVNSDNTVIGQVSLGRCVYNVNTQAGRPEELQVWLPASSTSTNDTAKQSAFWPILVNQLTAETAKAERGRLNVSHCFAPPKS